MLRRRRTAKQRSRATAMALRQRSATFTTDSDPMRGGIHGSGILQCLRRCRKIFGTDSVRDIKPCFMAGLDRATEAGSNQWAPLILLRSRDEVVGNLGVDSDGAAIDQVRLVAVGFGGGEGSGLEQVRAADHMNFLDGSDFGNDGVEDNHSVGVGEIGEGGNLGLVAGNFEGVGGIGREFGDRVGGGGWGWGGWRRRGWWVGGFRDGGDGWRRSWRFGGGR